MSGCMEEGYVNMMRESAQNQISASVESQEYNLVATLRLNPFKDGKGWCVLWGENIQEGICGFGDTPYKAILDFNNAQYRDV